MWAVRETETPAWGQGIPGSLSWPQRHLDLYKLLSCCDGSDVADDPNLGLGLRRKGQLNLLLVCSWWVGMAAEGERSEKKLGLLDFHRAGRPLC